MSVSRRIKRAKSREKVMINMDESFYWSWFYSELFRESPLSYRDIFNHIKIEFIKYANWANEHKYRYEKINTESFHEYLKPIVNIKNES